MNINDTMKEVHDLAIEKGWYEKPKSPLEALMLMVSELSEAAEEVRKGTPPVYQLKDIGCQQEPCIATVVQSSRHFEDPRFPNFNHSNSQNKLEGELIELADAVIRIFDYAEFRGFDLEEAIAMKHAYNKFRSYKHGNKLL